MGETEFSAKSHMYTELWLNKQLKTLNVQLFFLFWEIEFIETFLIAYPYYLCMPIVLYGVQLLIQDLTIRIG